jgi:hypothetical protein
LVILKEFMITPIGTISKFLFVHINISLTLRLSMCLFDEVRVAICSEPNCVTRKWTVLGEVRIGIFALRDIKMGEELTYDYNFQWFGGNKIECRCGAPSCVGYLGAKSRGFQVATPNLFHTCHVHCECHSTCITLMFSVTTDNSVYGAEDFAILLCGIASSCQWYNTIEDSPA